jgi:hypothetical protein
MITRAEFLKALGALAGGFYGLRHAPPLDFDPYDDDTLADEIDALDAVAEEVPPRARYFTDQDDWEMILADERGRELAREKITSFTVRRVGFDVYSPVIVIPEWVESSVEIEFDPVAFANVKPGHSIRIFCHSQSIGLTKELPLLSTTFSNGGDITITGGSLVIT